MVRSAAEAEKQPEKRVRTYVMREDRWKTLEAWPAPVSRTENFIWVKQL